MGNITSLIAANFVSWKEKYKFTSLTHKTQAYEILHQNQLKAPFNTCSVPNIIRTTNTDVRPRDKVKYVLCVDFVYLIYCFFGY